jgi:diguanylate cyclase
LEVTETVFLQDTAMSAGILGDLSSMGIKVIIDDFGVGFSSMNYLQRMPVNALKIDRSFVSQAPHNTRNGAIVKAIVAMATSLELGVIAEGVETAEEEEFLKRIGCHEMQGYWFGHPVPEKEFAQRHLVAERPVAAIASNRSAQ